MIFPDILFLKNGKEDVKKPLFFFFLKTNKVLATKCSCLSFHQKMVVPTFKNIFSYQEEFHFHHEEVPVHKHFLYSCLQITNTQN